MQIITSKLEEFFQQLSFAFAEARADRSAQSYYQRITSEAPSGTERNVYPWLARTPALREFKGERVAQNLLTRNYVLANKMWEGTIAIDANKLKDDTYGFMRDHTRMLGLAVEEHPDLKVAETVMAGVSTECWDGQNFFDTEHPVNIDDDSLGVFPNLLTGASYDLSADPKAAYKAARIAMMSTKRDDNKPLSVVGNLIMVPSALEEPANIAVNAGVVAQAVGASAAAGVTNTYQGSAQVLVNPWLNDEPDVWYLLCTTRGIMPFLRQIREAAEFQAFFNPSDPQVFRMNLFEFGTKLRDAYGYTFPYLAFRMDPNG